METLIKDIRFGLRPGNQAPELIGGSFKGR